MKSTKRMAVWVPGETCDEGLVVLDEHTGDEVLITQGRIIKDFAYPLKSGRFVAKAAVRAELVRSGERCATVKLPDGNTIGVRIVAGWQLGDTDGKPPSADGHLSPRPESAAR